MSDERVRISITIDLLDPFAAVIREHGLQEDHGTERWVSGICAGMLHEGCPVPEFCGCSARGCDHRKPDCWRWPGLDDLRLPPLGPINFPPRQTRDWTMPMPYRYGVIEPRPFPLRGTVA